MKSILLRFPDKVVRYIRGENVNEKKFDRLIGYACYFGCTGWCVDNEVAHNSMGWDATTEWEKITEVKVEDLS
jgi:hypothetical protein